MLAGISTLGITFGYAPETVSDTKPTTGFKQLNRINSIAGISITPETIDASALEDEVERSIAGRASTGGQWEIVVNYTDETAAEWEQLITAYNSGSRLWFEVISKDLADAFFVVAQPPKLLPLPELSQNQLLTMTISLTIEEYKGHSTKVDFD